MARVITSLAAPKAAAPIGAIAAILNASLVGCRIIMTPKKPTKIAAHRFQLTASLRIITPRMVVSIGATNAIAIASVIGSRLSPVIKKGRASHGAGS